jgi:hypothetical protein
MRICKFNKIKIDLFIVNMMAMVDVRCRNFNNTLWAYVAENARLRKISRCEALEMIVEEHMRILAEKQVETIEEGG